LHSFLKDFVKETGVRVSLTAFAGVEALDGAQRTTLYRVAQEALANVARHAHASQAEVTIRKLAGDVSMEIRDNGRSFDAERVLRARKGRHLGLLGMRERVEMAGGRFAVAAAPGRGTTVQARIPFHTSARKRSHP
jgi:signal transduction histidine kinase